MSGRKKFTPERGYRGGRDARDWGSRSPHPPPRKGRGSSGSAYDHSLKRPRESPNLDYYQPHPKRKKTLSYPSSSRLSAAERTLGRSGHHAHHSRSGVRSFADSDVRSEGRGRREASEGSIRRAKVNEEESGRGNRHDDEDGNIWRAKVNEEESGRGNRRDDEDGSIRRTKVNEEGSGRRKGHGDEEAEEESRRSKRHGDEEMEEEDANVMVYTTSLPPNFYRAMVSGALLDLFQLQHFYVRCAGG